MAAPYFNLQNKTENAIRLVLLDISSANRGAAAPIIGLDKSQLVLPRIECKAEQGEELSPDTGVFWMECTVEVYSSANAAESVHQSRAAYVLDSIVADDALPSNLSGKVADFFCQAVIDKRPIAQKKEDRHFVTGVSFRALCCPSDL